MAAELEASARADWLHDSRVHPGLAAGLDAAWLLVFVAIGRSSHTEGLTVAGVLRTLWPFWAGLVAGWLASRAWHSPGALVPTGVVVWLVCVAAAMALRALSGQGVAAAFIGVAVAFIGLGLLGWRALAHLVPTRSGPGSTDHQT